MANKTGIEWTDFTSNPLRYRDAAGRTVWACEKVSPGCKNCYSEAIALRFDRGGPFGPQETRALTPHLDEKELRKLLTSRAIAGKRVFAFDMTDLFGEWVPDELIAAVFGIFAARPDVTFQVLTKRAARMRAWFRWIAQNIDPGGVCREHAAKALSRPPLHRRDFGPNWPLPNVWLGVSVENQECRHRLLDLYATPAAVRFVSLEPLLEAVDLGPFLLPRPCPHAQASAETGETFMCSCQRKPLLDWAIVGGESGPGARPCDVAWIRSVVEQCRAASVPAFVKQLGAAPIAACGECGHARSDHDDVLPAPCHHGRTAPMCLNPEHPGYGCRCIGFVGTEWIRNVRDRKGGDPAEWPEDLRVRDFPSASRAGGES